MQDPDTEHIEPMEASSDVSSVVEEGNPVEEGTAEVAAPPEIAYTFALPESLERLIKPISSSSPAGVNMDEVAYEDTKRAEYNQLSREIKKRRAREIDFDKCANWASEILSRHSKDLQVAIWYCIACLWSEAGNETEKLRGFRDALAVFKGLLETHGEKLYPLDMKAKHALVEELGSHMRFSRLTKIETQAKKEFFNVNDDVLERMLKVHIPVAIRNKVQDYLGDEEIEGADIFDRRLNEVPFGDLYNPSGQDLSSLGQKLAKVYPDKAEEFKQEFNQEKAVEFFKDFTVDAARLPIDYPEIEFKVSKYAIHHLKLQELPAQIVPYLDKYQDVAAVKEDQFRGKLDPMFRSLKRELDPDDFENFRKDIIEYSNENRWLFLEIRECLAELNTVVASLFPENPPSLKRLEDLVNERAAESEAIIKQKTEEATERQAGMRARIAELENQVEEMELVIESLKKENVVLSEENEALKKLNQERSTPAPTAEPEEAQSESASASTGPEESPPEEVDAETPKEESTIE